MKIKQVIAMSYLCMLVIFPMTASSQITQELDSAQAFYFLKQADTLIFTGKYQEAVVFLNQNKLIFEESENWTGRVKIGVKLGTCFSQLNKYDEAFNELGEITSYLNKVEDLKAQKLLNADVLDIKGSLTFDQGDYPASIKFHKNALKLRKQELTDDHVLLADSYNGLAITYDLSNIYDSALYFHQKSLDIRMEKLGLYHQKTANTIYNMGIVYDLKGRPDKAQENFEQALAINLKILRKDHPNLIYLYLALGVLLKKGGLENQAIEYYFRGLNTAKRNFGENHSLIALCYYNMGSIYSNLELFEESLENLNNSLSIYKKLYGDQHLRVALNLLKIGILYDDQLNHDLARVKYMEAASIIEKNYKSNNQDLADLYKNIGRSYRLSGEMTNAKKYLKKALNIYLDIFEEENTFVAEVYLNLEITHRLEMDYDSAQYYIQKALAANSSGYSITNIEQNPSITGIKNKRVMAEILLDKALVFYSKGKENDLRISHATVLSADSLIKNINKGVGNYGDRLALNTSFRGIYGLGISVSKALYEMSGDITFKNESFYYAEKIRSGVLNDALLNRAAQRISIIPDSLLEKERFIKNEISFYQSKIATSKESTHMTTWSDLIFNYKRSLDSLLLVLEKNYPAYYQAKYDEQIISVKELQKKLSKNEALIEYAFTKYENLAMVITVNSYHIIPLPLLENLDELVNEFREAITSKDRNSPQNFKNYSQTSYQLFNVLFLPLKDVLDEEQINSLFIVPDKNLHGVPYEALLSKPAESDYVDYSSLGFLINDYTINYQYSASLGFRKKSNKTNLAEEFIGFAPSFEGLDKPTMEQLVTRGNNINLEWTARELSSIQENMDAGNIYLNEEATENLLKKEVKNARILHLATHAFIDEKDPMNSKILLSQSSDSLEDGILHAFEIYGMDINADMVTLSACNTGSGKLSEGEGSMSLARAFSYAGVPSVVMSHWEVDDKRTSQLMSLFYENLANGFRKDDALRQAKLQLMKEGNIEISNPYFWAAFVVVGDTSPIVLGKSYFMYWLAAGVFCLIALLVYWKRKIILKQ